jgi:hypothetical protein
MSLSVVSQILAAVFFHDCLVFLSLVGEPGSPPEPA